MTDSAASYTLMQKLYGEQAAELARLKSGGGGGTSGDMTDDWKDSVNSQLSQLHGDVRHLLYGLIGGFLFLLAAGAGAYAGLADRLSKVEASAAAITVKVDQTDKRLDRIERILDERLPPAK